MEHAGRVGLLHHRVARRSGGKKRGWPTPFSMWHDVQASEKTAAPRFIAARIRRTRRGLGTGRLVLQVDRDGVQVGSFRMRGRIDTTSAIDAAGVGVRIAAGLQILGDVVGTPGADAGAVVCGQVWRHPVVQRPALQRLARLVGAEQVLGRVAGAAVAEAVDEIGAAVPLGRLGRRRLELAGWKNSRFQPLTSERKLSGKGRSVGRRVLVHGRHGLQEGEDRVRVRARDAREVRVGHGRIELLAMRGRCRRAWAA